MQFYQTWQVVVPWFDKLLVITTRRIGCPTYLEMIKEMEKELNKVIKDFGLAVNVEALQPAQPRPASTHFLNLLIQ